MTNVYAVVDALEADGFAVAVACDALRVGRSGYYAYRQRPVTARRRVDHELRPIIQRIFWQHRRRYGARRIGAELAARGRRCGQRRIARLMKDMGLVAIQPRSFRPRTTDSRHRLGYSPNLLLEAPLRGVDRIWVGDITYIPLKTGTFAYLALLMDLFSRRIVGWNLADHMSEPLVLAALRQAIVRRQPKPGLIHHSDRGGQYAGAQYRQLLARAHLRQSMSRKDNCYDNAFLESCFGTIKAELEMTAYDNLLSARRELCAYIAYYDLERRHSSLAYQSPAAFERQWAARG